jgi:hypothetical protein
MFMYSYCYVCSVLYILVSTCQLALFGYPDWGLSVLFPQLYGKCQGITHKDGARPALFPFSLTTLGSNPRKPFNQNCQLCCCLIYCLCVNVYCTTATGCQPNCSYLIYHISNTNSVGFSVCDVTPTGDLRTWRRLVAVVTLSEHALVLQFQSQWRLSWS